MMRMKTVKLRHLISFHMFQWNSMEGYLVTLKDTDQNEADKVNRTVNLKDRDRER